MPKFDDVTEKLKEVEAELASLEAQAAPVVEEAPAPVVKASPVVEAKESFELPENFASLPPTIQMGLLQKKARFERETA
jgi:hypothetical protein